MLTSFMLKPRPPFRLDLTAWALRRRPANVIDRWDGSTYRRAVRVAHSFFEVEVRQVDTADAPCLEVSALTDGTHETAGVRSELTATLGRVLGLDADLDAFYKRASADPDLGPLAERFRGLKPPRFPTMFECLANAIACQQLTLTVGILLLNRLAESCGPTATNAADEKHHAFPDPGDLVSTSPDALRDLGFSARKGAALVDLAGRIADGELDLESLKHKDAAAASASLQTLRGVGRWSAEYALLRGLGRLEVFPGDDVGARNNLARRLGLASPLDYDGVEQTVARWAPYAGLAYFHLLLERIEESGWL